jgi:hypothetical protein
MSSKLLLTIHLWLALLLLSATTTKSQVEFVCDDDFDCQPNGFCANDQRCSCTTPYIGDQCEYECPIVCQNGGLCNVRDEHGGIELDFYCVCRPGYNGGLCQNVDVGGDGEAPGKDNDDCPLACQNGGTCNVRDEHGGVELEYYCVCPHGYKGGLCQNSAGAEASTSPSKSGKDTVTVVVAIVITVGAVMILGLLGFLIRRRCRHQRGKHKDTGISNNHTNDDDEKIPNSIELDQEIENEGQTQTDDDGIRIEALDFDERSLPSVA